MKRCGKCGTLKPEADFHRSRKRGYQLWCKTCRKTYDAAYWRRNRDRRRQQKRQNTRDFRAWYVSLREGRPCSDCGLVLHPSAMQWDHLPGHEKVESLGDLVGRHNYARVLAEIAKGDLVCASCHALRTLGRNGA